MNLLWALEGDASGSESLHCQVRSCSDSRHPPFHALFPVPGVGCWNQGAEPREPDAPVLRGWTAVHKSTAFPEHSCKKCWGDGAGDEWFWTRGFTATCCGSNCIVVISLWVEMERRAEQKRKTYTASKISLVLEVVLLHLLFPSVGKIFN